MPYPLLADPACWSWPVRDVGGQEWGDVVTWQQGRCALCGVNGVPLCRDHDYANGLRRGMLCRSCNLHEGFCGDPRCACAGYRRLHPAAILGIQVEHGGWGSVRIPETPEETSARVAKVRNRRATL